MFDEQDEPGPTSVLNLFQQVLLGNPVLGHKKIGADKHLESIKRSTDLKSSLVPSCNYRLITRFFLGQHLGDPWECLEMSLPGAIKLKRSPPSRVGSHSEVSRPIGSRVQLKASFQFGKIRWFHAMIPHRNKLDFYR